MRVEQVERWVTAAASAHNPDVLDLIQSSVDNFVESLQTAPDVSAADDPLAAVRKRLGIT